MKIDATNLPFPILSELTTLLETEINIRQISPDHAVTLTFRDPTYSPETGGFHPVEIRINSNGHIEYITDFAYAGVGPFAELVKEIDFDFRLGLFQHFGREYPMSHGQELFEVYQQNFLSYYAMKVYGVEYQLD